MKIVITDADGNEYVGTIADSEIYSRARETVRIKDARIFWPGTGVNRRIFADNLSFVKTVGEYDTTITVTTNNTVE